MFMNWVDLIILIVVLVFVLEGQRRGFLYQVFDIVGFLISLLTSLTFYPISAQLLIKFFNLPKIAANPVGFLLIWVIVESLFFAVSSGLISKLVSKFAKTPINRFLGFTPAIFNALLFLAFVLLFVVSLPIRPEIKKDIFDSKIAPVLVDKASLLGKPINSIFGPIAKQTLTFLTINPQETGSVPLEFTPKQLTVDAASEKKMFELVNQERIKYGVRSLIWSQDLAEVGRNHSKDMFERSYFSHYSPEGKDVGNRLIEVGIPYTIAGENLALAPDVSRAHNGLINSQGHRRNILDPAFAKIGIGTIDGGIYGKMFTQVFTD